MENIYLSDSIVDLKRHILEAGERILAFGACGPENAQFHQARYKLYSIAGSDVPVSDASAIAADADVLALARDIFPISCDAGVLEECRIAENLLGESNLTFGKIYRAYHGQIYQGLMEDELIWLEREGQLHSCTESTCPPGATQCCRIGYIGGGALPLPAMLLAQRLGYQVVMLDPHTRSAAFAAELIAKVGLDHLVRVVCIDGSKYDFSDCDWVFVSNWIADKQPLLRHLRKFTNIQHFIFRSAPRNSLSFIINDMIDPDRVCEHGFRLRHQTEKRPGLSLISLIFSPLRQSEATESTEIFCRAYGGSAEIAASRKRLVIDSITDLIGNTPILKLNPAKTSLANIDLYAKLEHLNPFGSIKDRTAWAMLRPHVGNLQSSNKQLLELSSGNAARALQALASIHGSALETITNRIRIQEMRRMLVVQGAKVSPIAGDVDPTDAMAALLYVDARAYEQRDRYLYTDQYRNPNNDCTHYATTAREILEDLGPVDYFFAPVGTAGSSIGISRRLREANEKLKVAGIVSTKDSAIPGIRHMDEMFYVGPFEEQKYDQLVDITASEALDGMLALIRDYGVMAGPSSGATYLAALRYLRAIDTKQTERKSAVIIVCDRVELYLSWIEQVRPELFEGSETPEAEHATVATSAALGA